MLFEEWKEIKEFEGRYAVSNLGNVKSLAKCNPANGLCWPERPLKQHFVKAYLAVWLRRGVIHKKFFVHQLVASHFIENPDGKPFVNHINKMPADNRVKNLEWCTHAENIEHRENYQGEDEPFDPSDIPF